jgi:hypothetical protein
LFFANVQGDEYDIYGTYSQKNLTITSYSSAWNDENVKLLYDELQKNFISNEYDYLSDIFIYPDSPNGVNGEYFDDISVSDGKYICGNNAVIKLYNGERYNTVEKIAATLSHEYGHHYTIVNIFLYENKYLNNWFESGYGKLRLLDEYAPFYYSKTQYNYSYNRDITEIAANDYFELLGSDTGKSSTDYHDTKEQLAIKKQGEADNCDQNTAAYNLVPQKNPDIPLAADVNGLYEYLLKIGGYTGSKKSLSKYPALKSISYEETPYGRAYTAKWTEAIGGGPFEYTLIMYGKGSSVLPIPIKTVRNGEELCAYFGSGYDNENFISKYYYGEYEFVIFVRDVNGFIYSTKPQSYNFSTAQPLTVYVHYPSADGTLDDVYNAVVRILKKEERSKMIGGSKK